MLNRKAPTLFGAFLLDWIVPMEFLVQEARH